MEEVFVIAYYGSVYVKVYGNGSWKNQYIGEGIVYESTPLSHYPDSVEKCILRLAPNHYKYKYAKIEKRFYPTNK